MRAQRNKRNKYWRTRMRKKNSAPSIDLTFLCIKISPAPSYSQAMFAQISFSFPRALPSIPRNELGREWKSHTRCKAWNLTSSEGAALLPPLNYTFARLQQPFLSGRRGAGWNRGAGESCIYFNELARTRLRSHRAPSSFACFWSKHTRRKAAYTGESASEVWPCGKFTS